MGTHDREPDEATYLGRARTLQLVRDPCRGGGDAPEALPGYPGDAMDWDDDRPWNAAERDADGARSLGVAKWRRGLREEALADLDRADGLVPEHAAHAPLPRCMKKELGMLGEALGTWTRADTLQADDADTLQLRGDTKRLLGEPRGALADLDRAAALRPDDPNTLAPRGASRSDLITSDTLFLCGVVQTEAWETPQRKEARAVLDAAHALQPDNAAVLSQRGMAKLAGGFPEEALADLELADAMAPDDRVTLAMLALTKYVLGRDEDSVDDLERLNIVWPRRQWTLFRLGHQKLEMGKFEEALRDFNQAAQLVGSTTFDNARVLHGRGVTFFELG
eukprot:jgi/Botrbrau1/17879/Bobra.0717s0002.1